jgi:hypothetical protein
MARSGQVWSDLPGDTTPFPINKDPHGATYDIVTSGKTSEVPDAPRHSLLPSAIPRSDERNHAFNAGSVMDIRD